MNQKVLVIACVLRGRWEDGRPVLGDVGWWVLLTGCGRL